MKPFSILLALAVLGAPGHGEPSEHPAPGVVSLPSPRTEGKVSVEAALRMRRSTRSFAATPLTLEEVGQLCWSAQGVTDEKGHRTAPSAHATYALQLYVVAGAVTGLPSGLYHYQASSHSLKMVAAGDRRVEIEKKGVGQAWIASAPAVFVISGQASKLAGDGTPAARARGEHFMWVEAGLAAQGFFLEAVSQGLGSTYVGGFRPSELRAVLGLPSDEEPLAVLPVGRRP